MVVSENATFSNTAHTGLLLCKFVKMLNELILGTFMSKMCSKQITKSKKNSKSKKDEQVNS